MWSILGRPADSVEPKDSQYRVLAFYEIDYASIGPLKDITARLGKISGWTFNTIGFQHQGSSRSISKRLGGLDEIQSRWPTAKDPILANLEYILDGDHLTTSESLNFLVASRVFVSHCRLETVSADKWKAFVVKAAEILKPKYGFGFQVNDNLLALSWPLGVGNATLSEASMIGLSKLSAALDDPSRPLATCMHDLYEINIVSEVHLEIDLGGFTLRNYIDQNRVGDLSRISNHLWLWQLSEKQQANCRKLLLRYRGLIVDA